MSSRSLFWRLLLLPSTFPDPPPTTGASSITAPCDTTLFRILLTGIPNNDFQVSFLQQVAHNWGKEAFCRIVIKKQLRREHVKINSLQRLQLGKTFQIEQPIGWLTSAWHACCHQDDFRYGAGHFELHNLSAKRCRSEFRKTFYKKVGDAEDCD